MSWHVACLAYFRRIRREDYLLDTATAPPVLDSLDDYKDYYLHRSASGTSSLVFDLEKVPTPSSAGGSSSSGDAPLALPKSPRHSGPVMDTQLTKEAEVKLAKLARKRMKRLAARAKAHRERYGELERYGLDKQPAPSFADEGKTGTNGRRRSETSGGTCQSVQRTSGDV